MKQLWIRAVCLAVCAMALTIRAGALSYTDPMNDVGGNNIKTYNNFQLVSNSSVPQSAQNLMGGYALTIHNVSRPEASAQYQVQGAQSVTVGIYTRLGTFTSEIPRQSGVYGVGVIQDNMSYLSGQTLHPLQLGSDGMVYATIGGSLYRLRDNEVFYEMAPLSQSSGPSLGTYGVSVFTYGSGSGARAVSLQRQKLTVNTGCIYEEFSGSISSDTTSVQVVVNDFSAIEAVYGGGTAVREYPTGMRTTLKQVTFTGSNLVMGVPETVSSQEEVPQTSQEESQSSKASGKKAPSAGAAGGWEGGSGSSSSGGAMGKFEGQVTSTAPGTGSRSSSQKPSTDSGHSQTGGGEKPEEPEPRQEEPPRIVQILPGSAGSSGMSRGITVYIVVLSGLIAVLLLRRGSPK